MFKRSVHQFTRSTVHQFSAVQAFRSSVHQVNRSSVSSWGFPVPRVKLSKPTKVLLWALQLYLVALLVLILVRFLRVVG